MKRVSTEALIRLDILRGQIYAACRMGSWCFGLNGHLYFTTAPHEEEYRMLLQTGGVFDMAMEQTEEDARPRILNGSLGLTWIAEWVHEQDGGGILILLGPVYLKNYTVAMSLQRLDRMGISQHIRRQYYNVLADVPVLSWNMLRQYACMLHYIIYEENFSADDLVPESPAGMPEKSGENEAATQPETNDYHRLIDYEKKMLEHLSRGEYPQSDPDGYNGELQDFHLNDLLRQTKDNLIIFTALCARQIISGGVPVLTAKNMENHWIARIEGIRAVSEAHKMNRAIFRDFAGQIKQNGDGTGFSRTVRECMGYVRMNYMKPLKMEDLARQCGYTEYYLTRKFMKETGMKLTDYIRSVRIDAAKVMLLASKKDIQQISEELQFGSQNYFDRVFRLQIGVSPAQYRANLGQVKPSGEAE